MSERMKIAGMAASALVFVSLMTHEGYVEKATIPVPGDVPTIGFGTTAGVKLGDRTDPVKALQRAMSDIQKFEGAIKQCVKVPLHQYEYDSYLSLSYNIGPSAFCGSSLVKFLNQGNYEEACKQILRWDKFKGQPLRGLTIRREKEYRQCIGQPH